MSEQIRYPIPTALDIRAAYALAKVYTRFGLADNARMLGDALQAAADHAADTHTGEWECPVLFADEPELVAAWEAGALVLKLRQLEERFLQEVDAHLVSSPDRRLEQRAESLAWLANHAFPTASALWLRLQTEPYVLMMGCTLRQVEQGIQVDNPYGTDQLLEPSAAGCQRFLDILRSGEDFSPIAFQYQEVENAHQPR
jgi:hypothetical protein